MPFGVKSCFFIIDALPVSFFALFLLILHGIRNTIDCKRETKWNIKKEGDDGAPGGYGTVYIFVFMWKAGQTHLAGKRKNDIFGF